MEKLLICSSHAVEGEIETESKARPTPTGPEGEFGPIFHGFSWMHDHDYDLDNLLSYAHHVLVGGNPHSLGGRSGREEGDNSIFST